FDFGYTGEVFPVGRDGGTAFGRDVLPSVTDLPPGIDVAIVITPSSIIPEIVNECGHKGIKWIVIESGGFGEFSESGKHLGHDVLQAAKKWGIRLVGPNGLGIINMDNSLVTPFVAIQREALKKGKVAILSQSGGVLFGLINLLGSNNIGVSKVVSIGNKLDLDEIDYLTYLIDDKETEIIVLYLEGISNGRKLMDIAKRTTKPIIVQKTNRYASSNQIARFHTEALATDDRVVDAALKQAGIVRARTFREVVDFVKILSIPPMKGKNLAIISRSGGIAISIADFASEYGFRLCSFSESFLRHVQDTSKGANVIKRTNPLDLGDVFDFDFYAEITEDIMNEKVDGVLFQLGTTSDMEVEASIALVETFDLLAGKYQKPISVYFLSDEQSTAYLKRVLDYPLFTDPAEAMLALAVSRDRYRRNREIEQDASFSLFSVNDTTISNILERTRKEKRALVLSEALEITKAAGIDTAPYAVCSDPDQAIEWADRFGYPLALKINVPSIVHKTDIQGIALNIADHQA
ncbi:MAG: acetate--CoA ligase family protein, partial [Desulfuromonadales bacterium]|nr:acetate--CoA ligase family protein [Desulfuromonadales bacterium]